MFAAYPIYRAAAIFSPAKRAAATAHDFACKGMRDIRPRMNHGASPIQKLLCFLKNLSTDDCGMRIYRKILFLFAVVDFLLPRKAACGIFLLRQRITSVFFILYCQAETNKNSRKLSEVIKKGKNICDYKLYAHTLILQERSNSPIKQRNISS